MKAIEIFENHRKGIISQLQILDVYFLCLVADLRNEEIPQKNIKEIIDSPVLSTFNMFEMFYKPEDYEYLERTEKIKYAGQQILQSIYTALENYFFEKFKEYFSFKLNKLEATLIQNIYDNINFRGIDDIKKYYKEYLNISLPSFDIERYYSQEKCNFKPKNSWEAIILLSKIRNDVAHEGMTKKYKITTLLDCWYPLEFVKDYIFSFDANFDSLIYEGKKTKLILSYEKKIRI